MALQRTASMRLKAANRENVLPMKSADTKNVTRSALCEIGNKVSNITIDNNAKRRREQSGVSKKGLVKNKGSASLLKLAAQQNAAKVEPRHVLEEVTSQASSLSPMDISDDGYEAFSKDLNVEDIDINDWDNPQLASEYVNDIYSYMRQLEKKYVVQPNYLHGQEISGKMRAILIDWLCQVHHRFHLLQETLYLTVSIIDRFLQVNPVSRGKLQLVGVTSMLVASKYEEMYSPEVSDFVYITDNAYTKAEIKQMEILVLKTMDFQLGKPLCLHFLRRNSKAGQVDANKHTLAKYLMELTIIEYDMVHYYPSQIAAAALCLSMKLLDGSKWTDTLVFYSRHDEDGLRPLMQKMASLVMKAETSKLAAVRTKYQSSKFLKISTIPELHSKELADLAGMAL